MSITGFAGERAPERFKETTVAIVGLPLGGEVFRHLVRQGFERFHFAGPSDAGGAPWADRMERLMQQARALKPGVTIEVFLDGLKAANLGKFLKGVDWVIDAAELSSMSDRIRLNDEALWRGLPTVCCGSIGFVGSCVVFENRSGPTFADLSGVSEKQPLEVNAQRFSQFLVPRVPEALLHELELAIGRATEFPTQPIGVAAAALLAAGELTKQVLGVGDRIVAPYGLCLDSLSTKVDKFIASHEVREHLPNRQGRFRKAA